MKTPDELLAEQVRLRKPGFIMTRAVLVAEITDGSMMDIVIISSGMSPPWEVVGLLEAGKVTATDDWLNPVPDDDDMEDV